MQRGRRGRQKLGALRGRQPQSKQTEAEAAAAEEADAPANMAYFMQPSRPAAVQKSPGMWASRRLQGGFRGDRSDRCAASCHGHARKTALTGETRITAWRGGSSSSTEEGREECSLLRSAGEVPSEESGRGRPASRLATRR